MSLRIELRNYMAVRKADIELADLTVLAGVNASGKSTIARIFHTVVETNRNYEVKADGASLIKGGAVKKLLSFYNALQKIHIDTGEIIKWISDVHFGKENAFDEGFEKIQGVLLAKSKDLLEIDEVKHDRRWLDAFGREVGESFALPSQIAEWALKVMNEIKGDQVACRSGKDSDLVYGTSFLSADLDVFTGDKVRITISDGESLIFDNAKSDVNRNSIYSPDCSIYLKADRLSYPITESASRVTVGSDTYKLRSPGVQPQSISTRLEGLMHGRFSKPADADTVASDWNFSGGVGESEYRIPIRKSADGMRALAPLVILDKYGLLNPNTLLVVDEPESHLHPQWIVEVADMLVWLVKERKMRILVATHSPYLVRALKTASLSELESGQLRYYLARAVKDDSGDEKYEYDPIGDDISPIFRVFNVALDKISFYER